MKALPVYICGNQLPSSIARGIDGFIRSSLGDFGHNGRGFLIWTFAIFLPPRGKQRRMAPKAARGSRLKPGSQERRPLDPQPLVRGGITRNSGFGNTGSGGNGLAAASEGEIDLPLYAPGFQSNVGLAQEVVSGAGYCEQVAAAAVCLLPSTDPSAPACTLEAIRDYRQGRVDLSAQGEVGENFFSLSDQSQDSDADSTSPSIDSETCDSSTAPLTPISVVRGTTVKRQSNQTEITRLDKAGESSKKRGKKKKKVSRTRAMSWDYTETQQLLHSMGDLSVAPAQTEVNVLNVESAPPSPSLHLIYQTITSQHKQTQRDSKKARVATKQLQVAISKVAKTCSEIGERIVAIECRAEALESDLGAVTKQAAMHESQLSDIQWKVEDFENRQRRNNLRLIGIQEEMGAYACKGRGRRRLGEAIWAPFAQWLAGVSREQRTPDAPGATYHVCRAGSPPGGGPVQNFLAARAQCSAAGHPSPTRSLSIARFAFTGRDEYLPAGTVRDLKQGVHWP
ncbi:hypothetical protein NDU88_007331 [Pleurodeles waltl]|uniref:Uncharacterized protein n=1 Tax=Pleurodeles waltl TaxID=8319 RepID=A0AAV7NSS8_PLEWA|nr:hypothetical protein NDU88_007331 [Pleurodeles waltl]